MELLKSDVKTLAVVELTHKMTYQIPNLSYILNLGDSEIMYHVMIFSAMLGKEHIIQTKAALTPAYSKQGNCYTVISLRYSQIQ